MGRHGQVTARKPRRVPSASGMITRLAYSRAESAGVDMESLLKRSRLTLRQIADDDAKIAVRDQIRFLNLASNALQDDLLGLHLAQTCELREIGLFYYVVASSDTLLDALRRGARYTSVVNEGISQRCIDGDAIGMAYKYVGVSRQSDRHQIEFWMTALARICRQLTGRNLRPYRVRLNHWRARSDALADALGSNIEFGSPVDDVAFPAGARELALCTADPYLNRMLISYCEDAVGHRATRRGLFQTTVENAIASLLPHGLAHVAEVARRLGVSERTLDRRLTAEGLSFTEVREKLRIDLADCYLADETLSISQIAWLLGFREVSSFSHAFKRWSGKTPNEARSSL